VGITRAETDQFGSNLKCVRNGRGPRADSSARSFPSTRPTPRGRKADRRPPTEASSVDRKAAREPHSRRWRSSSRWRARRRASRPGQPSSQITEAGARRWLHSRRPRAPPSSRLHGRSRRHQCLVCRPGLDGRARSTRLEGCSMYGPRIDDLDVSRSTRRSPRSSSHGSGRINPDRRVNINGGAIAPGHPGRRDRARLIRRRCTSSNVPIRARAGHDVLWRRAGDRHDPRARVAGGESVNGCRKASLVGQRMRVLPARDSERGSWPACSGPTDSHPLSI